MRHVFQKLQWAKEITGVCDVSIRACAKRFLNCVFEVKPGERLDITRIRYQEHIGLIIQKTPENPPKPALRLSRPVFVGRARVLGTLNLWNKIAKNTTNMVPEKLESRFESKLNSGFIFEIKSCQHLPPLAESYKIWVDHYYAGKVNAIFFDSAGILYIDVPINLITSHLVTFETLYNIELEGVTCRS